MRQPPLNASSKACRAPQAACTGSAKPHTVRIIGGMWRRTRLPVTDKAGLRPTPDRVRETLFNWLGQDLTGWRCIDTFAGTGALGFEAASRGAKEVRLIERDSTLVTQLKRAQAALQANATQVIRGDGLAALRHLDAACMDAIFLDPPFDSILYEAVLQAAARAIAAHGYVYLEAPVQWSDAALEPIGLQTHRYLKAGAVHAHLLKRCGLASLLAA